MTEIRRGLHRRLSDQNIPLICIRLSFTHVSQGEGERDEDVKRRRKTIFDVRTNVNERDRFV